MRRNSTRKNRQKGSSVLEFALIGMPTVFLLLGVVVIGIDLSRAVQVAQICRDSDSMFVRGAAMYSASAQAFIARLGAGMNMQTTGGDGLITLSKVQFIPDPSCGTPASPTYANCTTGVTRLMQRIVIGDTTLPGTTYPTHGSVTYDALDQVNNYLTDGNAVIDNFATLAFQLKPNEISYISEAYFRNSFTSLNIWSSGSNQGVYSQAFF
jgi:Flp pilus assembly protein TadG